MSDIIEKVLGGPAMVLVEGFKEVERSKRQAPLSPKALAAFEAFLSANPRIGEVNDGPNLFLTHYGALIIEWSEALVECLWDRYRLLTKTVEITFPRK